MTLQISNYFNFYINFPPINKEALFPKELSGELTCLLDLASRRPQMKLPTLKQEFRGSSSFKKKKSLQKKT